MIYIRANRRDYDHWAELGATGWDWASIHLYFERTLLNLNVTSLHTVNPLSQAFVQAAVEAGFARNHDFNGADQDGFGFYQVTQQHGRRHSAADAFLHFEIERPNLTIATDALATKILFEHGRACGVRYRVGQQPAQEARAEREVVLAAGAVNSPQLLMLSGIGPADHLRTVGVNVIADLPGVGENLQDHPCVPLCWVAKRAVSLAKAGSPLNLARYLLSQKGPLSSNVAECGGFVRTQPGLDRPDLQFHFAPAYFLEHGFRTVPGHGFTVGPTLVRPESRGQIRLRSSEPTDAPLIRANYLQAESDLRVLTEGMRMARRIVQSRALEQYRGEEYCPGSKVQSDDELAAYARNALETLYHPAGTCRMGSDAMSVVDVQLRVRGVEGLRVADASIMPEIVTGNTNAPVMMLAEKAAAIIREEAESRGAGSAAHHAGS